MFARLVGESFARNPRRKVLTAAALVVGMAVVGVGLVRLGLGRRLVDAGVLLPARFRRLQ